MTLSSLLDFHVSAWELFVRGTLMYWFLFLVFRFVLRRDAGSVGIADILLVVLVADASQNAMTGGYQSVAEGATLVCTLVGWNYVLDWGAFRFKTIRRFVEPPPLLLIDRGRIIGRNLRREMVTREELDAKLRQHGFDSPAKVRKAFLESDGEFSVLSSGDGEGN